MEMDLYSSSLIGPALGVVTGICVHFFIKHRKLSTLLMLTGFFLVTVTSLSINHCLNAFSLEIPIKNLPFNFLCNTYMPDIKGISYILIAAGLGKLFQELKKNA